ncbi:MAG: signal peptide peptidase SppA [Planctomycetota bacterium]
MQTVLPLGVAYKDPVNRRKHTTSKRLPQSWLAALALLGCVAALAGCGPTTFVVGVTPGDQRLKKTVVARDGRAGGPQVAIIDVSGLIANAERRGLLRSGENPVATLQEKLGEAAADRSVVGVILRINSPGGTVTASDVMHREIERFRLQSGKPVVALMMDVAASGGYYVSLAADETVAHPTTITGSVGVIVQTISVEPALARLGVRTDAIKSGPNKDAGSPLSTMDAAQRATLQTLVDDFYDRFLERVRTARPGVGPETMAQATDGRVYSGTAAYEMGMVDGVGDLYTALDRAVDLAGVPSADLVLYHRPLEYVASPYAQAPAEAGAPQVNLLQLNVDAGLLGDMPAGAYYLWVGP